jgi:hypothetical protein
MACGARPGTGAPAATCPQVARRRGTAAGRVPAVAGDAARVTSRRARVVAWVLAAGVATAAAVRAPGAAGDVRAMLAHLPGLRLSWLGVAVAAHVVSLASGTVAQRQLLTADGARLPWRTMFGLVFASTGLARLMSAGPVTAGAWQAREYRRRGAGAGLGAWAVLAGGFTAISVSIALLLTGAAAAGTGGLPLLACAAAVLAAAVAGLTAAPHPARALSRFLGRHHDRWRGLDRLAAAVPWCHASAQAPDGPRCWRAPAPACSPRVSDWPGCQCPGAGCCSPTPPGSWAGGSYRCPAGLAAWKAACSARSRSAASRPPRRQPPSSSTG